MIVYEFADGSWTDEVSAREDRIDTTDAVAVAEITEEEWASSWYATYAKRALERARQ